MGLKENLKNECVKDLPLREVIPISAETPVIDAIERLRGKQLGCAVVVDDQQKPLGMFTERMVIELALQKPDDLDSLVVKDHLETDFFTVRESDPVCSVMQVIREHGARFLCVVDDEGCAVSLTGQKGLAEYVAEHFPRQVMVQRVGAKPGQETREGA